MAATAAPDAPPQLVKLRIPGAAAAAPPALPEAESGSNRKRRACLLAAACVATLLCAAAVAIAVVLTLPRASAPATPLFTASVATGFTIRSMTGASFLLDVGSVKHTLMAALHTTFSETNVTIMRVSTNSSFTGVSIDYLHGTSRRLQSAAAANCSSLSSRRLLETVATDVELYFSCTAASATSSCLNATLEGLTALWTNATHSQSHGSLLVAFTPVSIALQNCTTETFEPAEAMRKFKPVLLHAEIASGSATPTPSPSPSATPTPSPSPSGVLLVPAGQSSSSSPTLTRTVTPTPTPSRTVTRTSTVSPSGTPTPSASGSPTPPPQTGVTTLAGSSANFADGVGAAAAFNFPTLMVMAPDGALLVADFSNHRIRRVDAARSVTTFAGSTTNGNADGQGAAGQFNSPTGVAVDTAGNVYVADYGNHRVRTVTPTGLVSTLAGSSIGSADGQGAAAQFSSPHDVAVDPSGNVYVADRDNQRIRKITPTGLVSSLAGSTQGFADGVGVVAKFFNPHGLAWDAVQGRLLIADTYNYRVRAANVGTGAVTTLAGASTDGYADGPVASARLRWVTDIDVDSSGNIVLCDSSAHKIRMLSTAGIVSTLAGSQFRNNFADGLGLSVAAFNTPWGVAVNSSGHVFVGERYRMGVATLFMSAAGIAHLLAPPSASPPKATTTTTASASSRLHERASFRGYSVYSRSRSPACRPKRRSRRVVRCVWDKAPPAPARGLPLRKPSVLHPGRGGVQKSGNRAQTLFCEAEPHWHLQTAAT
jgi:sugar lactone lactonase YvrE